MAKKSQIFKSFADMAADMMQQAAKQADNVTRSKRPRIIKTPQVELQKIEYTPPVRHTAEETRIHNAWNKYKNTGVYATMPEEQAYKLFLDDWNFRHNASRTAVRDLGQTINQIDKTSGTTTPSWMRHAMTDVVSQHPQALMPFPSPAPKFGSKQRIVIPEISDIVPDYFAPQQYRGINNIDTMFEQAEDMSAREADDAAMQFLSAGLSDAAAIVRGAKPTSFKYKPSIGRVEKPVLQEIVARRNAPAGTLEWLENINVKNPDLGISYLDMFAQKPLYFQKMFTPDGTMIK